MDVEIDIGMVDGHEITFVGDGEQNKRYYFSGGYFSLISLGSPHVRPMGRTRGEADEIELTAAHGLFYRSFSGEPHIDGENGDLVMTVCYISASCVPLRSASS